MGHRDVTGGFLLQAHAGRKFQVPRSDWAISWSRCLVPGFTLPRRALIAISQIVAALTCTSADASEIAARASRFNLRLSESHHRKARVSSSNRLIYAVLGKRQRYLPATGHQSQRRS